MITKFNDKYKKDTTPLGGIMGPKVLGTGEYFVMQSAWDYRLLCSKK